MDLFESVPNFSEGRDRNVIDFISGAVDRHAHWLDEDFDRDHNRVVISLLGSRDQVADAIVDGARAASQLIDLREHTGVHPRVGATDVVPIVPLGETSIEACRELAREIGGRVWTELHIPVFFYGYGEKRSLADIRAGRAQPDLGGPAHHPTAGAVCVGARRPLVAFNVLLPDATVSDARSLARSLRESAGGLPGVQALAFELPGGRLQLSMNLFRVEETSPAAVVQELMRRGVRVGEQQVVGLCPAVAANQAAAGRILEARIGSSVARAAVLRVLPDEEGQALARRLEAEAAGLARLNPSQEELLAGAERCAALPPVLHAAGILDAELDSMARLAARGFRAALNESTRTRYAGRLDALDRRLS